MYNIHFDSDLELASPSPCLSHIVPCECVNADYHSENTIKRLIRVNIQYDWLFGISNLILHSIQTKTHSPYSLDMEVCIDVIQIWRFKYHHSAYSWWASLYFHAFNISLEFIA